MIALQSIDTAKRFHATKHKNAPSFQAHLH